ncbi:putative folate/biopterin transporter [Leptomonas pyrrhocoris]|uniref:Putative folate/biopterin transporter n=1 Tax=Leptomonas pyrrhocoris TaxID=157538 RepID=A0A0M9G6S6_LEPPY|nr:putative folate/biopterin transporter [Leptomonas pyrrhocoris]KPA83617.1 putative folate/biopterin transporter [Leptomonas pyrrhocoris]|eukprot:XP_015662056.1 putative folate/biopterin transporter [Leptomonas pyrrhocoris]
MAANIGDDREKENDFNSRLRVDLTNIDVVDSANQMPYEQGVASDDEEHYVHPDARALFAKVPWTEKLPIFSTCCQGYGPKCTIALGCVYFLSKGIANNLITYARYAMFVGRFGTSGMRYQRLVSITKMGWSIKAFAAMLSDSLAVFGYTKRWYCAASCVIGAALTVGYGCLPQKPSSADIAAGFVFLTGFFMANVDILSEGHYSRLMRRHPRCGPALVSWVWWFILGATIVAAVIQGPLSDKAIPQVGLYVAGVTQLITTTFFVLNWYGERRNRVERLEDVQGAKEELKRALLQGREAAAAAASSPATGSGPSAEPETDFDPKKPTVEDPVGYYSNTGDLQDSLAVDTLRDNQLVNEEEEGDGDLGIIRCCGGLLDVNKEVIKRNWRLLIYSSVMVCSLVTMTCMTILGTKWQLLYTCIAVVVACAMSAFWALPLLIAKVNIYFFCYALLYLQLPGALDSFYMAKETCLPNGPHFSYTFYNTISAVIGNVAGIAAVSAFPYIFSKHSIRFTLMFTYFIQVIASVFDIVIVKRWNMDIGIPDHAMYLFGDAVVYEVSYYLAYMPTVVLLSRVCPRGSESMVYAVVAGFGNLGNSLSSTVGSLLMEFVWPITTSAPCDFSNVPMLLLVGHILLPMLIVPLSFVLVPAARICDDIDVTGQVIRKEAKKIQRCQSNEAAEPANESRQ